MINAPDGLTFLRGSRNITHVMKNDRFIGILNRHKKYEIGLYGFPVTDPMNELFKLITIGTIKLSDLLGKKNGGRQFPIAGIKSKELVFLKGKNSVRIMKDDKEVGQISATSDFIKISLLKCRYLDFITIYGRIKLLSLIRPRDNTSGFLQRKYTECSKADICDRCSKKMEKIGEIYCDNEYHHCSVYICWDCQVGHLVKDDPLCGNELKIVEYLRFGGSSNNLLFYLTSHYTMLIIGNKKIIGGISFEIKNAISFSFRDYQGIVGKEKWIRSIKIDGKDILALSVLNGVFEKKEVRNDEDVSKCGKCSGKMTELIKKVRPAQGEQFFFCKRCGVGHKTFYRVREDEAELGELRARIYKQTMTFIEESENFMFIGDNNINTYIVRDNEIIGEFSQLDECDWVTINFKEGETGLLKLIGIDSLNVFDLINSRIVIDTKMEGYVKRSEKDFCLKCRTKIATLKNTLDKEKLIFFCKHCGVGHIIFRDSLNFTDSDSYIPINKLVRVNKTDKITFIRDDELKNTYIVRDEEIIGVIHEDPIEKVLVNCFIRSKENPLSIRDSESELLSQVKIDGNVLLDLIRHKISDSSVINICTNCSSEMIRIGAIRVDPDYEFIPVFASNAVNYIFLCKQCSTGHVVRVNLFSNDTDYLITDKLSVVDGGDGLTFLQGHDGNIVYIAKDDRLIGGILFKDMLFCIKDGKLVDILKSELAEEIKIGQTDLLEIMLP